MNHRYIYLPSNSTVGNTTTEFTTKLAEPLVFPQNSKVALVEVIYKHSWNVSVGYISYSIDTNTYTTYIEVNSFKDSEKLSLMIQRINESIKELIIKAIYEQRFLDKQKELKYAEELKKKNPDLNYKFKTDKLYPVFSYDQFQEPFIIAEIKNEIEYLSAPELFGQNNILKLKIGENFRGTIQFFGSLVKVLEIEDNNFLSKKYKYTSNEQVILSKNISLESPVDITGQLYIYAPDLIDFQLVGTEKSPLLGIVVVEPNSFKKVIKITLDPPHYLNIKQTSLSHIKIFIKDQFGNRILFDESNVILKLDIV